MKPLIALIFVMLISGCYEPIQGNYDHVERSVEPGIYYQSSVLSINCEKLESLNCDDAPSVVEYAYDEWRFLEGGELVYSMYRTSDGKKICYSTGDSYWYQNGNWLQISFSSECLKIESIAIDPTVVTYFDDQFEPYLSKPVEFSTVVFSANAECIGYGGDPDLLHWSDFEGDEFMCSSLATANQKNGD